MTGPQQNKVNTIVNKICRDFGISINEFRITPNKIAPKDIYDARAKAYYTLIIKNIITPTELAEYFKQKVDYVYLTVRKYKESIKPKKVPNIKKVPNEEHIISDSQKDLLDDIDSLSSNNKLIVLLTIEKLILIERIEAISTLLKSYES